MKEYFLQNSYRGYEIRGTMHEDIKSEQEPK